VQIAQVLKVTESIRNRQMQTRAKQFIRPQLRFSVKTLLVAVTCCGIILAYVTSYVVHSRRGMNEARELELEGFLYVPWQEVDATHNLSRHHQLSVLYAPLNWIDQKLFDGPSPTKGITWELSRLQSRYSGYGPSKIFFAPACSRNRRYGTAAVQCFPAFGPRMIYPSAQM
jgi:hypothetical protein